MIARTSHQSCCTMHLPILRRSVSHKPVTYHMITFSVHALIQHTKMHVVMQDGSSHFIDSQILKKRFDLGG
jgi:hypothetical protein